MVYFNFLPFIFITFQGRYEVSLRQEFPVGDFFRGQRRRGKLKLRTVMDKHSRSLRRREWRGGLEAGHKNIIRRQFYLSQGKMKWMKIPCVDMKSGPPTRVI